MAAALLVVPALAAAWLWVAPRGRLAAVRQLGAGGAAMAVVGLAWPVLVWLTPAADRPWVSGTSDNAIWSLIFGYNGLGRLVGRRAAAPGGGGPGGGGGGGGGAFGGDTGRAAAAQREPRRPGRLAARLRASWPGSALVGCTRAAPRRPAHRLADRRRRRVR